MSEESTAIDEIRASVWYVEADIPDTRHSPQRGSAILVELIKEETSIHRKYLLTCLHVVCRVSRVGGRRYEFTPASEIRCWPPESKFSEHDRSNAFLTRVSSIRPISKVDSPSFEPYDDWVLLETDDEKLREIETNVVWGIQKPIPKNGLVIVGYPEGPLGFENQLGSKDKEVSNTPIFDLRRSQKPDDFSFTVDTIETKPGMSGGGCFTEEGVLVGVHRQGRDEAIKRTEIRIDRIAGELLTRGLIPYCGRPPTPKPRMTWTKMTLCLCAILVVFISSLPTHSWGRHMIASVYVPLRYDVGQPMLREDGLVSIEKEDKIPPAFWLRWYGARHLFLFEQSVDFKALSALEIVSLNVQYGSIKNFTYLEQVDSLSRIEFNGSQFDFSEEAPTLAESCCKMDALKEIMVTACELPNQTFEIGDLAHLEVFQFNSNTRGSVFVLKNLPALREVNVHTLDKLVRLEIGSTPALSQLNVVSDFVAGPHLPTDSSPLKFESSSEIREVEVTLQGVVELETIGNCDSLTKLILTKITNQSDQFRSLQQLHPEHLDLSFSNISSDEFKRIKFDRTKLIKLRSCPNITAESLSKAVKECEFPLKPDLQIEKDKAAPIQLFQDIFNLQLYPSSESDLSSSHGAQLASPKQAAP